MSTETAPPPADEVDEIVEPVAEETAEETAVEPTAELPAEADQEPAEAAPATADLSVDPIVAERDRIKQIRVLCDLAKAGDKFSEFVDANFSVSDTQAALRDLTGRKNSALESAPEPESDPDAKYRAEFAANRDQFSVTEEQYIRSRRIDDGLQSLTKKG